DLVSKEILEKALEYFPGTILFVSHDRYFMNKIADKVFHLEKAGLTTYLGNYDYFLEKKLEEEEIAKLEQSTSNEQVVETKQNLSFQEQKKIQSEQRKIARQLEKLEMDIEQIEVSLEEKETEMTLPEVLNDHEKLLTLAEECEQMKLELDELMEEWALLQE